MSDNRKTFSDCAPLRVVYRNNEADFAIVKANLKSPRFLDYRSKLQQEEPTVFAEG